MMASLLRQLLGWRSDDPVPLTPARLELQLRALPPLAQRGLTFLRPSGDGERAIVGAADAPEVVLFSLASGEQLGPCLRDGTAEAEDARWNADDTFAVVGFEDGSVCVWEVDPVAYGQAKVAAAPRACTWVRGGPASLRPPAGRATTVAWGPGERSVVVGRSDGVIEIIDWLATGAATSPRVLVGHTDGVADLAVDSLFGRLLSGSADGTVRLWDLASGACLWTMDNNGTRTVDMEVMGVALSADSGWALAASVDCTVRLWDLATGTCVQTLREHGSEVVAVAWHPRRLGIAASVSWDGTVRIWNVHAGACLLVLAGLGFYDAKAVVRWTGPDGDRLIACMWPATVLTWELGHHM